MATKTFPYAVIWGGEIVPPNTPIEVAEESPVTEKPKAEKPKKGAKKNDKAGIDKP